MDTHFEFSGTMQDIERLLFQLSKLSKVPPTFQNGQFNVQFTSHGFVLRYGSTLTKLEDI